jgi:hypothetical protein
MSILKVLRHVLDIAPPVLMLAACSTSSQNASLYGAVNNSTSSHALVTLAKVPIVAVRGTVHLRRYLGKNWMEPNAKQNRLLYVSDYNNGIVQVYNYPSQGTQNPPGGTLTGFTNPQGMCIDRYNNVYITNTGGYNVLEYAYGASTPKAIYDDAGNYAVACSWDRNTGDLAISDIFQVSGNGAVTICHSPSDCTTYPSPGGLVECFFIGYVPNGDLYVDGLNSSGFGMAYLPRGSSSWQIVSFKGTTINFPGGVLWDGTHLTVGDQIGPSGFSIIHQCNASGAKVNCTTSTNLKTSSDVVQYFTKRGMKGVIGPDSVTGNANTWSYPAGGPPRPKKIIHVLQSDPMNVGSAVLLPNE